MRAKFMGSNGLFCFISVCKFGSFKNPFAMITSLSELYFRIRRFILLVQTKKVISMNYGCSRSWKPWRWMRLDLIDSMWDIYINSNPNPLTKFISSSRSTKLKDVVPWNISQMIMKTISISTRIFISYGMKGGIPLWIWWKVNGNWDSKMIRISQWRENLYRTNTMARRKKEVQKSRTMRITIWELHRKVNHLSKVIWDRKIIRVHQVNQFHHQNR